MSSTARVPASTSNLGPGFDVLGLALDLCLEVELVGPCAGERHRVEVAAPPPPGAGQGPGTTSCCAPSTVAAPRAGRPPTPTSSW